jgi:hypothetical protein
MVDQFVQWTCGVIIYEPQGLWGDPRSVMMK